MMLVGLRPAEADQLLHPSSVMLRRGVTSATESEAVTDMQVDGDGHTYDVTATMRKGTAAMSFQVGIVGIQKKFKTLTYQWSGQPTLSCSLRLAVYDFVNQRWVGQTFLVDSSAPSLQSLPLSHPHRFVQHHHLKGRVSCSNDTGTFALSTDRIRLDVVSP